MSKKNRTPPPGLIPCPSCLCDSCANSVELLPWQVTLGEAQTSCFSCDECYHFDKDGRKRSLWREVCPWYVEAAKVAEHRAQVARETAKAAERRAQVARAAFRVIEGGE